MLFSAYSVGYDAGRSDEQTANHRLAVVHQILTGARPVTVDQSYIDQLHAALADARDASAHNYAASKRFEASALEWEGKAQQFRNEALYWRDDKYAPARAKAKARREENATLQAENARLREENAILLARLQQRNPTLAAEQAAHDETFKEK
jgi:epoxyqueuosine reductase QueG